MLNMRLTVSFQTHGRCAVDARGARLRISPSRPVVRLARPILFFFLGPTFIAVAIYFFCIAPFFFISRRSFHSPLLRPFVFHGAGSLGFSPSPRRFFPHRLLAPLSHSSLFPSASPHPLPCLYLKRITGLEQSSIWIQHLVRGSWRFSFPFYFDFEFAQLITRGVVDLRN